VRIRPALTPADRLRVKKRALRVAIVLAVASALHLALVASLGDALIDDTFIHLQFAKNFRDGHGLVFNPGERVFGTTSPLWSLGLGVLGRTGADLDALARGASVLFGLASLAAVALALRRFLGATVSAHGFAAGRAEAAWACGVLAFAADAWLVRWSATGMETSCGVFLVAAGFAAYFARRPWGNRVWLPALWWSVAALVRPEAGLLVVLLVVRVLLAHGPARPRLERAAIVVAVAAAVQAPWLAYAASFYGTLAPATLAAKTAGGTGPVVFLDSLVRQAQELVPRGIEGLAFLALLPPLAAALWHRRAEHFLPLAWLLGVPLVYALRGVHPISRYLLPLAPVLLLYGWSALAALAASERRDPRRAYGVLAGALALSLAVNLAIHVRWVVPHARTFSADARRTLGGYGAWARDHTPPGTPFAIPDIGLFAYVADRPVVDLAGLVTPGITPLIREFGNADDGTLVTGMHFESVARPAYLIDRAPRPGRLLAESPYAACLEVIELPGIGDVRARGLRIPETAYYTLYRIDWVAFDRMLGAERQASVAPASPTRRSVLAAMTKSFRWRPPMACVHQPTVTRPHSTRSSG
jgi:hypothetical protein